MAEPSNIRINPFTGTGGATNYVELTERHVIPAVSPYVIRLNEVPEKQDPSNMKMVYVDSATGAATENALTEVAATPVQGEFRPDYSTNAMEDKTWNTGLIEFSASDAGKIVQVTYTGTGTLAGVNINHWPSWYTDRGDGSDGDFVPTENTTISGIKKYLNVFVKEGITVTIKSAKIQCQGSFVNNGIINANEQSATTTGKNQNGISGAGGAGGGGGNGYAGGGGRTLNKEVYDDNSIMELVQNIYAYGGSGGTGLSDGSNTGGSGGKGGGKIIIIAKSIQNNGSITANGGKGGTGAGSYGHGGGGGGGGIILAVADYIGGSENITVTGGAGGTKTGSGIAGRAGDDGIIFLKQLGVI